MHFASTLEIEQTTRGVRFYFIRPHHSNSSHMFLLGGITPFSSLPTTSTFRPVITNNLPPALRPNPPFPSSFSRMQLPGSPR